MHAALPASDELLHPLVGETEQLGGVAKAYSLADKRRGSYSRFLLRIFVLELRARASPATSLHRGSQIGR